MPKVRDLQEKRGWAWTVVVGIVKPTLLAFSKRDWIDGEKIPATGGCVVVVNHISHLDPMTLGRFLYDHGRLVRYLTKEALFRTPVLKHIVVDAGQIPVARMTEGAASAFDAAVQAVNDGELVGIYPEGTITKDPDGWPMRGKTGAARIALATGCPVIPIGQWGAQDILPAYCTAAAPAAATHRVVQGGRPGRPRRPDRQAGDRRRAPRGDRPDHGRDHGARRGAARRAGPRRTLRPEEQPASTRSATPASTAAEAGRG